MFIKEMVLQKSLKTIIELFPEDSKINDEEKFDFPLPCSTPLPITLLKIFSNSSILIFSESIT